MSGVSRAIDRLDVTFDDESLVANAGLIVPATLMVRLGLESLINASVRLVGRVGGARPGRKVLTLVATIMAGGTHIDHAGMLRAGATQRVLPFRVMAPSTLGTFLRSFTFGHVRQLDKVIGETIRRAWAAPDRATNRRRSISTRRSARCTANRNTVPPTATPTRSATTRCLRLAPALAKCSTPGSAKDRRSVARPDSLLN